MHSDAAQRFAVRTCFVLSALSCMKGWHKRSEATGTSPAAHLPYLSPDGLRGWILRWTGPHTAVALPLYNSQRQIQLRSLLIVRKYTTFFRTELKCLPFFVGGKGEQQCLRMFSADSLIPRESKKKELFSKLNQEEDNTSSNCGCFSFTYYPSQGNLPLQRAFPIKTKKIASPSVRDL